MCCLCVLWKQCTQSCLHGVMAACVCQRPAAEGNKDGGRSERRCAAHLVADAFLMFCLLSCTVSVHFLASFSRPSVICVGKLTSPQICTSEIFQRLFCQDFLFEECVKSKSWATVIRGGRRPSLGNHPGSDCPPTD